MTQPPSFEPRRRKPAGTNSAGQTGVPGRRRPEPPKRRLHQSDSPRNGTARASADSLGHNTDRSPKSGPRRHSAFDSDPTRQPPADATRIDRIYSWAERPTPTSDRPHNAPNRTEVWVPADDSAREPISRPATRPQRSTERPPQRHTPAPGRTRSKKRMGLGTKIFIVFLVFALMTIGWGVYLISYGNSQLHHVDALSGRADTPGTTYLIVGSDERTTGSGVEGKRSDTIMLLHVPTSGNPALISIPRDSYVVIPGHGDAKINSAFSIGGPKLTVETVENLSGLTIDHYIQIGMDGVAELTDAVGGINLCYDQSFDDSYAKLTWEAGCHDVDGDTALKFSRMRYSDPMGDIGRTKRQRQVVSKIIDKAISPSVLINPRQQRELVKSGTSVLAVSAGDTIFDIAGVGMDLRAVMGSDGVTGTPPIADLNYRVGRQSVVLLDPATIDQFWLDLAEGKLTQDSFATK